MNPFARSWVGQVAEDTASLRSLLDSCRKNVTEAERLEVRLRAEYDALPIGDWRIVGTKDVQPLAVKIKIAVADQAHWREYVAYYAARVAAEGGDTMIPIRTPRMEERKPRPPSRPQREPGDDDAEPNTPEKEAHR